MTQQIDTPAPSLVLPAEFGAQLQGGFYAGPHWADGKLVHLIGAPESLGDEEWNDAKTAAAEYEGGGFSDWFLPNRDQLQIARIYAQDKFDGAIHWTSTQYSEDDAWAVGFEYGTVFTWFKSYVFRVRPFRRLSI